MPSNETLAERPLPQRVVLLGLAHFDRTDADPAHTGEIVRACAGPLEAADGRIVGRLGEAEVSRALNSLEAGGLVEMENTREASPVGKGRPAYRLALSPETVAAAAREDDEVAPLFERFAAEWD